MNLVAESMEILGLNYSKGASLHLVCTYTMLLIEIVHGKFFSGKADISVDFIQSVAQYCIHR